MPPIVWDDRRYKGVEAISEVYQMLLTRGLLILWPISSIFCLIGEAQDRKRHAA